MKVQGRIWIIYYAIHRLILIHPCAKYGKPMLNQKKVMGRTLICTDRRTDRVISIYPTELRLRGVWKRVHKKRRKYKQNNLFKTKLASLNSYTYCKNYKLQSHLKKFRVTLINYTYIPNIYHIKTDDEWSSIQLMLSSAGCIYLLLEYKKAPAAKMPAKNNDPTISVRVPPDPLPEPEGSSFR